MNKRNSLYSQHKKNILVSIAIPPKNMDYLLFNQTSIYHPLDVEMSQANSFLISIVSGIKGA